MKLEDVKVKKVLNRGLRPNPLLSGPESCGRLHSASVNREGYATNVTLGCLGPPCIPTVYNFRPQIAGISGRLTVCKI